MSILERCPSYGESNKRREERQGPTLSVRFSEVSVLKRCPLRESRLCWCYQYYHFLSFSGPRNVACSESVPGLLAKFVNE